MDKIKAFEQELNYIKDENIRKSLEIMINYIPDYFFHIAASSTGKYHPQYALGDGGLIRHTKAAVRMAIELFGIYKLHDGVKKGIIEEKYTRFDHPLIAVDFIKEHSKELTLNKEQLELVCDCISSHMGKFNTSDYSNVILPLPKSVEQKFVHMCDYLASRKVIDVHFDKHNNVIEE